MNFLQVVNATVSAAAKTYFASYSCCDNGIFKHTGMLSWQQNVNINLNFATVIFIVLAP